MLNDGNDRAEPHCRSGAVWALTEWRPLRHSVGRAASPALWRLFQVFVIVGAASLASSASAGALPLYRQIASVALGAPDRWDYVLVDPSSHRVFVAHGDGVTVVDTPANRVVGTVRGIMGGTHGIAISAATGQGFTDDGSAGRAVAFDLGTLAITRSIPSAPDADAIAVEPVSGHVFVVEGDPKMVTVIDPAADTAIATISADEKLEYAVADGAGAILVAGEEKGDLLRIDGRSDQVVERWPAPGCVSPHGLAYDSATGRAFMGCANGVMSVIATDSGRLVALLPIGRGNDAVGFDPRRRRVFSSNGRDGTISVYQQRTPDRYVLLATVPTKVSGRTMAVDPRSGRLYVAAADTEAVVTPNARPRVKPGTLRLLVFAPSD